MFSDARYFLWPGDYWKLLAHLSHEMELQFKKKYFNNLFPFLCKRFQFLLRDA